MSAKRRINWVSCTFCLLLALAGSLTIWFWPQSPRWRMVVPNPEKNPSKLQLLFFSEDSQNVFFAESDVKSSQASVAHYDASNGHLLKRIELWQDRILPDDAIGPFSFGHGAACDSSTFWASRYVPGGIRDIKYYDVYAGKIGSIKPEMDFNSFDISRARHWIRYSYRLAIQQSQTYQQNHLFIADFKTGEVVLHLQPDKDSVLAPSLSNGVAAVFDPTERFVALSWNSPLAFSWPPAPEKHQSQIRIYDLKAKKEVRRIELPCGSQWSVKAWEGNQLQTDRSWIESTDGTNFVNYSCINRIDLNDDPPHAVEYSTLQNSSDASQSRIVTNGADITYHQPERACVIRLHSWIFKKAAVPTAFRKIIDWFPSTKNFINDFYPETATQVSLLDQVTGKPLWDCPRLFRGSDELSPDGHSLALSFTKDDSIIVEMWDTHYPRRWLEVLGFFGVVGLWYCWRARKALRRFESSTVVRH